MLEKLRRLNGCLLNYSFLVQITLFSSTHTALICMVLIPFFNDTGMSPVQIAILLSVKKIVRIFSDVPFGALFDIMGAKFVFVLGRIIKLMSFLVLLFEPSFYVFIIAMTLDSLSYSSIYGKVSPYIYNNLSLKNETHKYTKYVAICYFVMNVFLSGLSFLTAILLRQYDYNILIYISIILCVGSLFFANFIDLNSGSDNKEIKVQQNKDYTIKKLCNKIISIAKSDERLFIVLLVYGCGNFIAWQFGSLASLVLLDMGMNNVNLTIVGSVMKVVMAIGCLIPIFFIANIRIQYAIFFINFAILALLVSGFIYNQVFFVISMGFIMFVYTLIEVAIEKYFETIANKDIRGTITSIGWFFCSLITTISILFVSYLAEKIGYQKAFIIFGTFMTVLIGGLSLRLCWLIRKK